jgi:hypothetical protein
MLADAICHHEVVCPLTLAMSGEERAAAVSPETLYPARMRDIVHTGNREDVWSPLPGLRIIKGMRGVYGVLWSMLIKVNDILLSR